MCGDVIFLTCLGTDLWYDCDGFPEPLPPDRGYVDSVDLHGATGIVLIVVVYKSEESAAKRGLAGTRATTHADFLTGLDLQVDRLQYQREASSVTH